ncbi:MAG TPA: VOC family protein [Acidimicrobiales bacterium]|nr:VOC family protein [Acidimicrobiales bacterium]
MHRSRLTAIAIDVPADLHDREATFWAGALGTGVEADEDGTYLGVGHAGWVEVFVQRLGDGPPRVHLDVETDDVDAEVARLEALGAERVAQIRTWWVMRDPAGLPFCVVRPQSDSFPEGAATWGGG